MNRKSLSSLALTSLLAAVAPLAGCAHLDSSGTVEFAPDPETNFQLGLQSMKDHRHLDAHQYFEHIRYRHPYAAVAALADLAIAENYYAQDQFTLAAESFRNFVTLRPNHPKVDYAEYMVAVSNYEDIPMDLFILPPSCEKDQAAVRGAADSFSSFLEKYPDSKYVPEARKKLQDVVERLADHELSIGKFYARHDHFKSAIARFTVLVQDFPTSKRMPETLMALAKAQAGAGEHAEARKTLDRLGQEYPQSEEASELAEARKDLDEHEKRYLEKKAKEEKAALEREEKEKAKKKAEEEKAKRKAQEDAKAAEAGDGATAGKTGGSNGSSEPESTPSDAGTPSSEQPDSQPAETLE